MICEILHLIFDALDDEFRFHDLDCSEECGSVRGAKKQISNAQNLRRINQRKGMNALINFLSVHNEAIP